MAQILRGAPAAAAITEDVRNRSEALRERGIVPCLAILRVGEREEDLAYERAALKRCEKTGVRAVSALLPADCTQDELMAEIRRINEDDSIHSCLMLRPLPAHLDEKAACTALLPEKDADGMTDASLQAVFTGRGAGYPPCTAQACMEILDYYGIEVPGKRAVVIGRSLVIGRPAAMMLLARNATVTICHTGTKDMASVCREADILVAAAGRAGIVDSSFIRPGQVVLDVGINAAEDGSICGDVSADAAEAAAGVTPVPGGVGSVTTAVLCKHVVDAASRL